MNTSEQVNELATALAKAQAVMEGAKKDRENPHFKSKFADLASVWEACRAALPNQGLSVVQTTTPSERDEVIVTTRLLHSSGQWIEGVLALPVSKHDAQGFGSALTYARRYGLSAIVGVAPEDDDGNAASAVTPEKVESRLSDRALADLKSSLNEARDLDDLRGKTQKALSIAHQGGDTDAHADLKAYATAIAESFKKAA